MSVYHEAIIFITEKNQILFSIMLNGLFKIKQFRLSEKVYETLKL